MSGTAEPRQRLSLDEAIGFISSANEPPTTNSTSKLCEYVRDGVRFSCRLCGDTTSNQALKRVCPVLRHGAETDGSWAYGITAVPERVDDGLLAKTIESLAAAGFPNPRLFIDGQADAPEGMAATIHDTQISAFGNWMLAAWELYLRNPRAKYYAIFQDDCLASRGLRAYLESCKYPTRGYWNLFTWRQSHSRTGWNLANQRGFGAVGLVFDNLTLRVLLKSRLMVERPQNLVRGRKNIDGGVVTALKSAGWREYVHNPSLIQHIGEHSTLGHVTGRTAPTYTGEAPATKRIGLVGYNCYSGLGVLNRQIANYADIWTWLVKPHKAFETLPPIHAGLDTKYCRDGRVVEPFIENVDVALFAETPYFDRVVAAAKKHDRKLACVPMLEWMPKRGTWVDSVDLFVCPTRHTFDTLKADGFPVVLFDWPVDVEAFAYRERTTCERFLFVNGHGGHRGRKGGDIVREVLHDWPEMPLTVFDQTGATWPDGVDVRTAETNSTLYGIGDVLIVPHHADGLALEPMEAAAAGMPAIITHGEPWAHLPAIASIDSAKTGTHWFEPIAENLTEICREMVGADIAPDSRASREWAVRMGWPKRAAELDRILQSID